jgi:Rrf2 family protein
MRLTRATDYAVRVLSYLGAQPAGVRVTRKELIEKAGVPPAFLNKIIRHLASAGLIDARPGVNGGCTLTAPPNEISLLRIVETIEGPVELHVCLTDASTCGRSPCCSFRSVLAGLQTEVVRALGSVNIADLLRDGRQLAAISPLTIN